MSQTTKKAFATSLKKLLTEKSLDKITVIDLAEDCEVNRQTFYYHFKDIYDLIEWIFLNDATKAINGNKTYDTWQQGFLHTFEYIQLNRNFVKSTYYSVAREHLERYLFNETYNLLIGVVEEKANGMVVSDEDKSFIANFYKHAFAGLLLEWISTGMKENPNLIIERLSILIGGDIAKALTAFQKD
ncbi:TetR/AcrR family transcriptional regulator [Anaeromicropila populeti]|uniref:Transcriptional regulator, TetR family n=1 Tax=Anaeromicropila populeti TaxID=37658 RepID=A0A1I6HNJ4_9FIRM|nr:TetR/AcrR family transcriptional regulator [Anaeromicropila populeti]SFR56016.1 transcriptional regulator, TetR family [Anaeromicropila populeti]